MLVNAIQRNVALNVQTAQFRGADPQVRVDDKKIRVVGGVYKLSSGQVALLS